MFRHMQRMISLKRYGADVMQRILKVLRNYMEDILIISGLLLITGTTFFIDILAGFYIAGLILLGLGIYFTRYPPGR